LHTFAETVNRFAPAPVGLKCTFHCLIILFGTRYEYLPVKKPAFFLARFGSPYPAAVKGTAKVGKNGLGKAKFCSLQ